MKGVREGSYVGVGGVPAVEGGRAKAVRRRGECKGVDEGAPKRKGGGAHRPPRGGARARRAVPDQGQPQPFFLPNESFSVVTRLNTGLSAVWSKRSAT